MARRPRLRRQREPEAVEAPEYPAALVVELERIEARYPEAPSAWRRAPRQAAR